MKTKNNVRNYILTIIGILTLCFASLIFILNENAKTLAYAAEDETVLMTENVENATIENAIEETDVETELSTTEDVYGGVSTLAAADTTVEGNFQWTDDKGNKHPLRRVKVEVYDYDPTLLLRDDLLGTTYTDHDGNYSLSFTNQTLFEKGGCDLYVKVYAGDGNVQVVKENGKTAYCYSSVKERKNNVAIGATETISKEFAFDVTDEDGDSNLGKAFQISQAALTARDFAWNMMNRKPSDVKIRYPYRDPKDIYTCSYSNGTIYITDKKPSDCENSTESYASWDVIMHEYGHHIQKEFDKINNPISASPNGGHSGNMIDHYATDSTCSDGTKCAVHRDNNKILPADAKEYGMKIAWAEGWATAFGAVTQKYYADKLTGIATVNDAKYSAYNFKTDFDYRSWDSNASGGEGNEMAIVGVLWGMVDNMTGSVSKMRITPKEWWDVTTIKNTFTFSDFINNFYKNLANHIGEMGKLLVKFEFTPSILGRSLSTDIEMNEVTANQKIRFTWRTISDSHAYPIDTYELVFYSEDYSDYRVVYSGTDTSATLSSNLFNTIKSLPGTVVHVAIKSYQSGNGRNNSFAKGPSSGGYVSTVLDYDKRVLIVDVVDGEATIIGTYCNIIGNYSIPDYIDGNPIKKIGNSAFADQTFLIVNLDDANMITDIGEWAFTGCTTLTSVLIPNNVTVIRKGTFANCGSTLLFRFDNITRIEDFAFNNTAILAIDKKIEGIQFIGNSAFAYSHLQTLAFDFNAGTTLTSIGNEGFRGNNKLGIMTLPTNVRSVGNAAFSDCDELTIYVEYNKQPSGWAATWNASNRPVFWGCTLSSDKSYVVSFVKSSGNPSNPNAANGINNPTRDGYNFGGWNTKADFSGDNYDDIASAPNRTLYAKWEEKSCVATGTMITLADGSQKAVEELTGSEDLLVWNMLTGTFDSAPILFIDSDPSAVYEIIKLSFSDGTVVKAISEHAFFNIDRNEYVFLRNDAAKYIGEKFNKQGLDGDGNMVNTIVTLTNVTVEREVTCAWSPVTFGHLCYYVNGMLSMPGATEGLINIFEVDPETMRYDLDKMNADILTYGLFTYEEFCEQVAEIPQEIFAAFNGQYLKVAIGKGLIDADGIIALIARYAEFFN